MWSNVPLAYVVAKSCRQYCDTDTVLVGVVLTQEISYHDLSLVGTLFSVQPHTVKCQALDKWNVPHHQAIRRQSSKLVVNSSRQGYSPTCHSKKSRECETKLHMKQSVKCLDLVRYRRYHIIQSGLPIHHHTLSHAYRLPVQRRKS